MFTALVTKSFNYVKVHPVLEVKLGLAPANGMTNHEAHAGDVMEFETLSEFKEMESVAAEGDGMLVRQYRLASTPSVSAPGMLQWAQNGYLFPRDRKNMVNVMMGWGATKDMTPEEKTKYPSRAVMESLVAGKVKHAVEDETVIFPVL